MIKLLNLKASTLCASGALLVLGGFMTVNLAGCGGGGGGGLTQATPRPVGATFRIVQQDGSVSRGGALTLTRDSFTTTVSADAAGVATVPSLAPGTYAATFTAFDNSGNPLPSTTRSIVIASSGSQSYMLVQGDSGNGQFVITGRVLLNATGSNDDDNNPATGNCNAQSVPVTSAVLISVRDLNSTDGTPIVAQAVRAAQASGGPSSQRGTYTVSLPFRPRLPLTFRVEVSALPGGSVPFAGISATTTFVTNTTTTTGVDVCTNINGVIPVPAVTATPIVTNTPFQFITPTPFASATPNATVTPGATATPGASATATSAAQATATAQANATATAGPNATATTAAATATAGPAATATAIATQLNPANVSQGGTNGTATGGTATGGTATGGTATGGTNGAATAGTGSAGSSNAAAGTNGSATVNRRRR